MSTEGTITVKGLPALPDLRTLPGESEHSAFHRRSLLRMGSPLCTRCATAAVLRDFEEQ